MKKFFLALLLFLNTLFITSISFACGGMTHMFVAREAISQIPDANLRKIIWQNLDAYLVGAYYPDSGYIKGNHYGEDSHWDKFVYTFADYIRSTYTNPATTNPRLIAFLMGCAAHRISDEISHFTFYHVMKDKDFKGNWNKAHSYGDVGIDLLINVDYNQWQMFPSEWWIPLPDLLNVYERMSVNVKPINIIYGVSVISMAGYGERLISLPAYPYLWLRMPWTSKNYYSWPEGGTAVSIEKVAKYQMKVWRRIHRQTGLEAPSPKPIQENVEKTPAHDFAEIAYSTGALAVSTQSNADGSITISQPFIKQATAFKKALSEFLSKITG